MANFGNFAGGLAQGIQAGLPLLMQQRQQQQLMELEREKMRLEQQKTEAATRAKAQEDQLNAFLKGVQTLKATNPEQVPTFTAGWISRWQQQFGELAPTLVNSLKRDPAQVGEIIRNANPDQVRAVMGNEQAFLQAWPELVSSAAQAKANEAERSATAVTRPYITQQSAQGQSELDSRIQIQEALIDEMNAAGVPRERVEAAQKRLDTLIQQRTSLATSPTAQAAIAAGADPSSFLSRAGAVVAQQRELELGRQKAFEETQARERAQFGERRLTLEEARALQLPFAGRVADYVGAGVPGQVGPSNLIPPSPYAALRQEEQTKSQFKAAEDDYKSSQVSDSLLPLLKQTRAILQNMKGKQGPIKGPVAANLAKLYSVLPGADPNAPAEFQSVESLMSLVASYFAKNLAPVNTYDVELYRNGLVGTSRSFDSNMAILGALEREAERMKILKNASNAFRSGKSGDKDYFSIREDALNQFDQKNPIPGLGKKVPAVTPAVPKPQPGKAVSSGVNLPYWKGFDPAVVVAIDNLPAHMHRIVGAIALQESGGKNDVTHAADAKGERAIGAFGIKPSSGRDFGLGVVSISNPKDPKQAAMFTADAMEKLLARYNGNPHLALAAYNQGMGVVDDYLNGKTTRAMQEGLKYARSVMKTYGDIKPLRTGVTPPAAGEYQPETPLETGRELIRNEGARAAGRIVLETAGGMLGGGAGFAVKSFRGLVGLVGGAAGTFAASEFASRAGIDPVADPETEAYKAVFFNLVPDVAGLALGKLFSPAQRSLTGQALEEVLEKEGQKGLRPLTVSESQINQAIQGIAGNSIFFGKKVIQQGEAIDQVISGAGAKYVKGFLEAEAQVSANYAIADTLRDVPMNVKAVKTLGRTIKGELGVTLQAPVTANPRLVTWLKKIDKVKEDIKYGDIDALVKDGWQTWFEVKKMGDRAAADKIAQIMRTFDMAVENSMKTMGRGDAYEALKAARAASKRQHQGMLMENMLTNATEPGTNIISSSKLLPQLTDKALARNPTKLDPESRDFLIKIAHASEENAKKNGFLRWTTVTKEAGGAFALIMGTVTGSPVTVGIGSLWMLAPGAMSFLATNATAKKLILDGMKIPAGSVAAFNVGSKLAALLTKEGLATPTRVQQNVGQQQGPFLTPQPGTR